MVFNQKSNMTNFLKANIETQRAFTVSLCSVSPLVKSNKTNTPTSGLLKRVRKYYLHLSDTSKSIQVNFVCLSLCTEETIWQIVTSIYLHICKYLNIFASLTMTDWLTGRDMDTHTMSWQWMVAVSDGRRRYKERESPFCKQFKSSSESRSTSEKMRHNRLSGRNKNSSSSTRSARNDDVIAIKMEMKMKTKTDQRSCNNLQAAAGFR